MSESPIVLVHGLFGSLQCFVPAFAARRVLAPDLLGYGAFRDALPTWTLDDQAAHLAEQIALHIDGPCHVVGHSVGGAVAMLFAHRHPERVRSLTSIEGNFTLADAFWSRRIAAAPLAEVQAIIDGYGADPGGWISQSGITVTEASGALAKQWLDNQPASTIKAQAAAVVAATAEADFLDRVRQVMRGIPALHLLAGARSRAGWSVPDWVVDAAASHQIVEGAGHLLMVEQPQAVARALLAVIDGRAE